MFINQQVLDSGNSSSLILKEDTIIDVSSSFVNFTGYELSEFKGKKISAVLKTLRISSDFNTFKPNMKADYFIFTKTLEFRNVEINIQNMPNNYIRYIFCEKPYSRFEDKFNVISKLMMDNISGIGIYSCPDLTLLKANQLYIDMIDDPHNKRDVATGMKIENLFHWWEGSRCQLLFNNVITTGNTHCEREIKGVTGALEEDYYDNTLLPVIEGGKVKYIISIVENVTEKVLSRMKVEHQARIIEKQNKELEAIMDNATVGLAMVDKNGTYIKKNRTLEIWMETVMANKGISNFENVRYFDEEGNELPFNDLPMRKVLRGEKIVNEQLKMVVDHNEIYFALSGIPIYDNEGNFEIGIMTSTNMTSIKKQEEIIRNQKRELEAIIENMSDGLFILNSKGEYTLLNESAKEFFFDGNGICNLGDTFKYSTFYDENGELLTLEETPAIRVLKGQRIKQCRITAVRPDGIFHFNFSGNPIYDDNGKVIKAILCVSNVTDIVEREELIGFKKEELDAIIRNISAGVFVTYKNGRVTLLNEEVKKHFYDPNSINVLEDSLNNGTVMNIERKILSYEDTPAVRALRGEEVKNEKIVVTRPDAEMTFEVNCTPIYDKDGSVAMAVTCMHDISHLIKQEKLINQQNKRLEEIIDNISDELYIVNRYGKYIKHNKAAQKNVDSDTLRKMGDFYEKFIFRDIDGKDVRIEDMPISKLIKGEEVKNQIIFTNWPKERYISVSAIPVLDSEDNFDIGVLMTKDVTTLMSHSNAIKAQLDMLYHIIDNLDLPLVRLSCPDLSITDINQKAYKFVKALIPETMKFYSYLKGKKVIDLVPSFYEDIIYKYISQAIKEKKIQHLKNKKFIVRGEEVYLNLIFEPTFSLNGEVVEVIIILIDVTGEVRANERMERALRLQEEFFANISHELKTPLNVIYSTVQLFNMYFRNGSLDEKRESIQRHLGSITQNCYRLSKLINNIVDISKIEAGFYELNICNHNIVNVVEEIVMSITEYGQSKGINVIFDTDVEEKMVAFDAEKIERVILNLISNAIKFSDADNEILIYVSDKGSHVEISVKDNGIGIDKGQLEKIFDRYKQADKSFSRNAEGTGIGLSLVKSIVELHRGEVLVESQTGKGSRFTVKLPSNPINEIKQGSTNNMIRNHADAINVELSDIYF
jgi:signal transduction histidine kinase/PAS domain-containing protein